MKYQIGTIAERTSNFFVGYNSSSKVLSMQKAQINLQEILPPLVHLRTDVRNTKIKELLNRRRDGESAATLVTTTHPRQPIE